jgi:tartrate dehydratase alpha subunit/fumarate hydratase class I-like protein
VSASRATLEKALATHARASGWPLNTGQKELAHHLVGAGTLLAAGVGPAGTGKTTAMKVVVQAWRTRAATSSV